MKTRKTPLPSVHSQSDEYKLSIVIPKRLIAAIDRAAHAQYRTRASVIRETLANKFTEVA